MKVCRLCRRYAVGGVDACPDDGGELLEGPVPPFAPGDLVGPYEVRRAFAAGDTGVLLSASRPGAKEGLGEVLVKALAPATGAVDARATVLESVAGLEVAGLLPVEDVLGAEGRLCVVRPFVAGTTLAARVKVDGTLAEDEVVDLGRRLCAVLAEVHGEGLAHGDVRPGHVLFPEGEGSDEALLVDLGSPSPPGPSTSPEQHLGKAAIPSSDVYGLCMTLYIALAGRSPFRAGIGDELTWLVTSSPPPPLRVMRGGDPVDPALERVIQWGLAKKPADRPAIGEVRAVLEAIAAASPEGAEEVLDKAPSPDESGRRSPPRDSIPPEALTRADESSPTLRVVRKLLPESLLKSTGLTQAFFVEGEEMEREIAELEVEEQQAARENLLAWVRAIAFLLIGISLAALAIWGLTR